MFVIIVLFLFFFVGEVCESREFVILELDFQIKRYHNGLNIGFEILSFKHDAIIE